MLTSNVHQKILMRPFCLSQIFLKFIKCCTKKRAKYVTLLSFLDTCNIPLVVYFGLFGIRYQVTLQNVTTSKSLVGNEGKDIKYDPFSRRLFFYDDLENLYSIEQDGSDLRRIEIGKVNRFTVDGSNNIIYYIHKSTDTIYMLNMTNMKNSEVVDLADVAGAKDIDMDDINK